MLCYTILGVFDVARNIKIRNKRSYAVFRVTVLQCYVSIIKRSKHPMQGFYLAHREYVLNSGLGIISAVKHTFNIIMSITKK